MSTRAIRRVAVVTTLALQVAQGSVLVQNGSAATQTAEGNPPTGQSVHTPASGGPWDHITFNLNYSFRNAGGAPYASGALYLLSQPYYGLCTALSTTTPGYIAHTTTIQSDGGGVEWVFDPAVVLQADQDYWFFMGDAPYALISFQSETYAAGNLFYAASTAHTYDDYGGTAGDAAFQLEGVPEPSGWMLMALAAGLLRAFRRISWCRWSALSGTD